MTPLELDASRRRSDLFLRLTRRARIVALQLTLWIVVFAGAASIITAAERTFYVANRDGTMATFVIGSDGSLLPLDAIGGVGRFLRGIVVAPNGRTAYVADSDASTVSAFAVDDNGRLTPIGAPVETDPTAPGPFPDLCGPPGTTPGPCPFGAAVAPSNRWLYVPNTGSDTISVFHIRRDGSLMRAGRPVPAGGIGPRAIAVSPNGERLYVGHRDSDSVAVFKVRGSHLQLLDRMQLRGCKPAEGTPPRPVCSPFWMTMTPDGRWVYLSNQVSGDLRAFAVRDDGRLTPVGPPVPAGGRPESIAITPDGRFLYAGSIDDNDVKAFAIIGSGRLKMLGAFDTCDEAHIPAACGAVASALAPNGKTLHVANTFKQVDDVVSFAIAENGRLSKIGSVLTGGNDPQFGGVAVRPNQGPTAALAMTGRREVGGTVSFDASDSADDDGEVARYDWDFGNGETLSDGGAHATHVYATPGRYTVTVTVTDNEGCSSELVFTGQTALCNGSERATASLSIRVRRHSR